MLHADIAAALANLSDLDKLYERTMFVKTSPEEDTTAFTDAKGNKDSIL